MSLTLNGKAECTFTLKAMKKHCISDFFIKMFQYCIDIKA